MLLTPALLLCCGLCSIAPILAAQAPSPVKAEAAPAPSPAGGPPPVAGGVSSGAGSPNLTLGGGDNKPACKCEDTPKPPVTSGATDSAKTPPETSNSTSSPETPPTSVASQPITSFVGDQVRFATGLLIASGLLLLV